jgi:hypothetical protein
MKYASVFIAFFLILFILTAFLLYFGLRGFKREAFVFNDA